MKKIISSSTENNYKLNRLKKAIDNRPKANIAIYGIGANAKRCLDTFGADRFIGLMDSKATGAYVYGKKVLDDDELLLLGVSVIVIAATLTSTNIVYDRIKKFCIQYKIEILDMYGVDLIAANRALKLQEINYCGLTLAIAKELLLKKKNIFVYVRDVLLSFNSNQDTILYETKRILEAKGVDVKRNFVEHRKKAQSRICGRRAGKLNIIYDFYAVLNNIDENLSPMYAQAESEAIKNNSYPRKRLLQLLKEAEAAGARIFVCVDVMGSEYAVKIAMESCGIANYEMISANNDIEFQSLYQIVRNVMEADSNKNILFIGSNRKHLLVPICYDVNYMYLKGAEQIYSEYNIWSKVSNSLSEQERRNICEKLDSPFLDDVDMGICLTELSTNEKLNCETKNALGILPNVTPDDSLYNSLIFPVFDNVEVSIIIPVYNQFSYTYNCLKSVLLNSEDVKFEVIVADDCSTDETKELDKFVSGINIIHNEKNLSFLLNCNNAAKYAKGKYILFLNNDTQVRSNWLKPLIKIFELYDDAGLAGSKFLNADGTLQEAGGIIWNDASSMNYGRGDSPNSPKYNYIREVDYISGASIVIPKSLWEEIGGFDERYAPAYCEDSDLAFEVRKCGKKVYYQPESEVIHFEGISNGKDVDAGIKSYMLANQEKLWEKWKKVLIKFQRPAGDKSIKAYDRKWAEF